MGEDAGRAHEDNAAGTDMPIEAVEDEEDFRADLSARLKSSSARALAKQIHWGRTVVTEIWAGRRLPDPAQLEDLLRGAGVLEPERAAWAARLSALRPPPLLGLAAPTPEEPALAQHASAEPAPIQAAPGRAAVELGPSDLSDDREDNRHLRPTSSTRRRSILLRSVVVATILVVAAAAALTLFLHRQGGADATPLSPSEAATSAPPSSSPSSKGGAAVAGTIKHPADGSTASSKAGVRLDGTFADDGVSSYWLVDRDSDGTYTADLPVTWTSPTTWTAVDQPLGDPTDLPTRVAILLVKADDACAERLRTAVNSQDSTFARLGRGCTLEDHRSIVVNHP